MGTLAAIRTGLQTRLQTIAGLRVYKTWPDQIATPAALIKREAGPRRATFGGTKAIRFKIVLVLQLSSLPRAQDALDPYVDLTGASSIIAAIVADDTLGGAADCILEIGEWSPDDILQINSVDYMGAMLDLEVIA